jgi:hypothetical protein
MPKKKTPKKSSGSPEVSSGDMPPVKLDPAAAEPALKQSAQQRGQDDDEQQGSGSGSDQEFSFGSINEHEANEFLNRIETMYGKQHGPLLDGATYISFEAREAFVDMYSQLRITNYDDEALAGVADLLMLGVQKDSLMQQLPALSKGILSTTDAVRFSTTENAAVQSKIKSIREAVIPSVEDIKQQLKSQVSDNGRSARQGFSAELHLAVQSLLGSISSHVGLKPHNCPPMDMWKNLTSTGIMTLLLNSNPLGSATMAFSTPSTLQSGGAHSTGEKSGFDRTYEGPITRLQTCGPIASLQTSSQEDQTGFESVVASMQGKSSKYSSMEKVVSLTGGLNSSLYFNEKFPHSISQDLLKTTSISFLSAIRPHLMVPTKFIESMIILNELVLLLLKFFKVVFKAFPALFIGLADKLDEALSVASHIFGNSRSYVQIYELYAQLGIDVAALRFLPYMAQEISKATSSSGTSSGGSYALVAKVYSLKLQRDMSLHEQILKQVKLVNKAIEFTPIPKGMLQSTAVHPALDDYCTFSILVSAMVEYLQLIDETESRLVLVDILKEIDSSKITTTNQILSLIASHSKSGKFQAFSSKTLGMALVSSGGLADQGNSDKSCYSFDRTGSCRFADTCRYLHSSKSASSNPPVKTQGMLELKGSHPKFSSVDVLKIDMYFEKTAQIQAYLNGAAEKLGQGFTYKIGKVFTFIRLMGKDENGGSWKGYLLTNDSDIPNVPKIPEVEKLLVDVRLLVKQVPALKSDSKQIPFPTERPKEIPISLFSDPGWPSKDDKSFKGNSFSKGFNGRDANFDYGSNYGKGSNYAPISKGSNYGGSSYGKGSGKGFSGRGQQFGKDNSGRGKGYSAYSREGDRGKGNSFLSAAEVTPPPPPPDWPRPPPSFLSGPVSQQSHNETLQQAMQMLLSQSQSSPAAMGENGSQSHIHGSPYSDSSSGRMPPYAPDRSPYATPGASFDTSGNSFWSHGSQYNGGKDGKGDYGFGGPQHRGADVPGKGAPLGGGWNFSC